jgi:hypothetical protein
MSIPNDDRAGVTTRTERHVSTSPWCCPRIVGGVRRSSQLGRAAASSWTGFIRARGNAIGTSSVADEESSIHYCVNERCVDLVPPTALDPCSRCSAGLACFALGPVATRRLN